MTRAFHSSALVLWALSVASCSTLAGAPPEPALNTRTQTQGAAPIPEDGPLFGPPSFRLYGGSYDAADNGGFANETHNSTLGFGVTLPVRRNPHLALDADLTWTDRDYSAAFVLPQNGLFTGNGSISTLGLTAGPRGTLTAGPARGYLGAGLGAFFSDLSVRGDAGGSPVSEDESDFSPGLYGLAGVDFTIGPVVLGVTYRYWWFEGSFSGLLDDVDLGGSFFGLVIGARL